MNCPSDNIGGDSTLKSVVDVVLYGLTQSPIVVIVSPLHRFEMAQMGPVLTILIYISLIV